MAQKYKSSDAGNLSMPKKSCKVLPVSEKVCKYRKIQYTQDLIQSTGAFEHIPHEWGGGYCISETLWHSK